MSDITTRAGKGSPLTNTEVDQNFTNLNNDKLESVSESDVTQHQAALSITESQISDLDKYTQAEVDTLLDSLEAYDQSLNTTDDVAFSSVQLTGGASDEGTLSWNASDKTVEITQGGVTLQLGQEIHYTVRNATGSTIGNGTFLGFSGVTAGSNRIEVSPFDVATMDAHLLVGFATEDISNGVNGKATGFGYVRGLDTRGDTASSMAVGDETWAVGDLLYVHPTADGKLTTTAPTSGLKAAVGVITNRHATEGEIFVRVTALDENAYATAAQGDLADSALQSGDNISELTNDASYATTAYVDTAESDAVTTANAYTDTRETAITTAYQAYADQAEADAISTAAADATSKANTAESNANSYTDTAVAGIVDSAPATLDTLNELAAALGDDPNFATTVTNSIAGKVDTSGDSMTGDLSFGDNDKAIFGAGSDLQIYHDGGTSIISDVGAGGLSLQSNGTAITLYDSTNTQMLAQFVNGAHNSFKYNGATKLETTSAGIDVTGTITTDGLTTSADINFGDNDKAVFGAGSDLQIYHDGSHSYIAEGGDATGNLYIRASQAIALQKQDGTEDYITANNNGAVTLYHNGSPKLATTSTGIDVTGNITVTGSIDGRDIASDGSKLDGIEAGAQVNVPTNLGIGTTSTSVSIVSSTGSGTTVPAATTSSAGALTAADKTKLDGIATNANNYSHPTYAGDDINLDTGALSGATVISDLDFNVTTDTQGHVTDANATYSTRNLTAADIGAQPAGTYNTIIGTDSDINTSGSTIIDNIYVTDGVITSMGTRTLTAGDLGALTGNQTITLSGDLSGSGTTSINAQLGSNVVGANELNVSGNGTSGQALTSDGDGSMSWSTISATPEANSIGATELNVSGNGAPGDRLISDGDGSFSWEIPPIGGESVIFNASTNWTIATGGEIFVQCIGGGGGGGGNHFSGGGGGGGGIYAIIDSADVGGYGSNIAITVGAGGGQGATGGTSSFGNYIVANGGNGGFQTANDGSGNGGNTAINVSYNSLWQSSGGRGGYSTSSNRNGGDSDFGGGGGGGGDGYWAWNYGNGGTGGATAPNTQWYDSAYKGGNGGKGGGNGNNPGPANGGNTYGGGGGGEAGASGHGNGAAGLVRVVY